MLQKQAFQSRNQTRPSKPSSGGWKWLLPPVLSVLTALTIWWGMPKPAIPDIYESANPVVAQATHVPTGATPNAHTAIVGTLYPSAQASGTGSFPLSSTNPPAARNPSGATTKSLVALGDSITFGYNLPGATATRPSPNAYPYLVGKQLHYQVTDLGVTGWTSTDLLDALQTSKYQSALRKANLVTVDIGSNDLLHTSYDLVAAMQDNLPSKDDVLTDKRYQQALTQYSTNLASILTEIRKQTAAPIVLLNLYDPFPDGSTIHNIGEQLIAAANQVIWQTAAQSALLVVDDYTTFNHHQDTLVRLDNFDIHPTLGGQQALARNVEQVLQQPLHAQPMFYAIAKKGLLIRSQPQLGPNAIHWLEAGTGVLVNGLQGEWLKVVTPSGQSGFVQTKSLNLVLRPWNNVTFTNYSEHLRTGEIKDDTTGKSADVFLWNGIVYAPIQYLAALANATVSVNSDALEVDVQTPSHSGLVQTGWLSPPPSSTAAAPSPQVHVQLEPSGPYGFVQFGTKGLMVTIDGEDVDLQGQVVERQGQVDVPVKSFWEALGGTVKPDANGLPQLSAAGS